MVGFADLVQPFDVDSFLSEHFGRKPLYLEGLGDRFSEIFSWQNLDEILALHRLAYPRLRVAQDGVIIDSSRYTVDRYNTIQGHYPLLDVTAIHRAMDDGAMLVLDAVDESFVPVRDLAGDVERVLRTDVQVNAYASISPGNGFGVHWDDHDVFVVQVAGEKRWQLKPGERKFPLDRDIEVEPAPDLSDATEIDLKQGSVLYVPRGHWHSVTSIDTPSLHLTLTAAQPNGADLIEWLAERMLDEPLFRRGIPRFSRSQLETYEHDLVGLVRGHLEDPDLVASFLAYRDSVAPIRPAPSIGVAAAVRSAYISADDEIRWVAPRAVVESDGSSVAVSANGRRWTFNRQSESILWLLHAKTIATVDSLIEASGPDIKRSDVVAFINVLRTEGLVEIRAAT